MESVKENQLRNQNNISIRGVLQTEVETFPPSVQQLFQLDLSANTSQDMKSGEQSILQIPELQFYQLLDEKEQKIYFLQREKQALNNKVERLRTELAGVKEEKMGKETTFSLKIKELEEALNNETKCRVEMEASLARRLRKWPRTLAEKQRNHQPQARKLTQVQEDLGCLCAQWEEEKTFRLRKRRDQYLMQKINRPKRS
ncbi:myosin-4-like protein [Lates japonicus]|uniref:Myosin-4-like protein n=1 Tax=Lates japonicus TaxID=270547 RepID=A0AAD3R499_LATJO|nr:myosin-4-like protein [Lates japonicus]